MTIYPGAINPFTLVEEKIGRSIDYQNEDVIGLAIKTLNVDRYMDVLDIARHNEFRGTSPNTNSVSNKPPTTGGVGPSISPTSIWLEAGDFFGKKGYPSISDPIQNGINDCGLIASITSLAWVKPERIKSSGGTNGQRVFTFFKNEIVPETVTVRETLLGQNWVNGIPTNDYARSTGGSWPALVEKAYAKWISKKERDEDLNPEDYRNLEFGDLRIAMRHLTGLSTTYYEFRDSTLNDVEMYIRENCQDQLFRVDQQVVQTQQYIQTQQFIQALHKTINMAVAVSRERTKDIEARMEINGIPEAHAFTLLGYLDSGHVVLRNPWGIDMPLQNYGGHQKDNAVQTTDRLDCEFAFYNPWMANNEILKTSKEDGIFALKLQAFYDLFDGICVANDPSVDSGLLTRLMT